MPSENLEREPSFITGMGGSAGALLAFEKFFSAMPPRSGIAFVVVQHLDPTQEDMLPEILQRHSDMKVLRIEEGMKALADHVYIIPPGKDLAIIHGVFLLLEPTANRGLRMPIDFFLRRLAKDWGERAGCIIFSGMGSDGSLGLKSIKEYLGMVMVQKPSTAEFVDMPQSAVDTGMVDYVAAVEDMPELLIEYIRHLHAPPAPLPMAEWSETLQKILLLLRDETGNDFSQYKINTVSRRVERRMNVHQCDSIERYLSYIRKNPHEVHLLFQELLIGVTSFFRNPEAFEALKKHLKDYLIKDERDSQLRVWIPGCSTGEEAYTIAIIIKECLEETPGSAVREVRIFASDIDKDTIDKARRGVYPANIVADVSPGRLTRFFDQTSDGYSMKKEIRSMLVFALQNLISDPPFTRMDLISCRNLFIYLSAKLQKKMLALLHYSLNQGGLLMLGTSETVSNEGNLFHPLDSRWSIYQRKDVPSSLPQIVDIYPVRRLPGFIDKEDEVGKMEDVVPSVVQRVIQEYYAPPAVLINEKGDIFYTSGHTGKFLELPVGKANMNILAMAREELRFDLSRSISQAITRDDDVVMENIKLTNGEGRPAGVNLIVRKLKKPESLRGLLLVVFKEMEAAETEILNKCPHPSEDEASAVAELKEELKQAQERLRLSADEATASHGELQLSNEELRSTNEELQSSNEELSTSREELQSLNEELITINTELQSKNEDLARAGNDMQNLINSTDIALLFLDKELRIRRFTAPLKRLINLIDADIGRPLADIAVNLDDLDLVQSAGEVMEKLVVKELEARAGDGRSHMVHITPYKTLDNYIDGVVLTFIDITDIVSLRRHKEILHEARE
ncbi:MAG: chemotaxis protein CheB, partial [bacterium]|nr:chemotaxis protein CheB [bacterium]